MKSNAALIGIVVAQADLALDFGQWEYGGIGEGESLHVADAHQVAREALLDEQYYKYMAEYGAKFRELSQKIWEEDYLSSP